MGRSCGSAGLRLITTISGFSNFGFRYLFLESPETCPNCSSVAADPRSPESRFVPRESSVGPAPPEHPLTPRGSERSRPGGLQAEDGEPFRPRSPAPEDGVTFKWFKPQPDVPVLTDGGLGGVKLVPAV